MNRKTLCIIIAVKDDERLKGTIQSLSVFRGRSDVKIIVVDSSSDPVSVNEYADRSLDIQIRRQRPSGIYRAMNAGLQMCNSTWCYFLNCGDYISIQPQVLIDDLESVKEKSSEVKIVSYSFTKDSISREWSAIRSCHSLYLTFGAVCHQAIVYRVDDLRNLGGFDCSYKYLADRVSVLQILRSYGRLAIIKKNRVICDWETEGTCTENLREYNRECGLYRRKNFSVQQILIGYIYTRVVNLIRG